MQPGQGPPPGGYGAPRPQQDRSPYGPYAPPEHGGQMQHGRQGGGLYQPFCGTCPQCGSPHLNRPTFTWWGGLLGPKLLNHTVCGGCGLGFNAKTGKSNGTAIGIYLGCGALLGILIVILRASM